MEFKRIESFYKSWGDYAIVKVFSVIDGATAIPQRVGKYFSIK